MKKIFSVMSKVISSFMVFNLVADDNAFPQLSFTQTHENGLYRCNETAVISVAAMNRTRRWKKGKLRLTLYQDHAEKLSETWFDLSKDQPIQIRHTFKKPGFISVHAEYLPEKGKAHNYETVCGAGADPEKICAGTSAPADLISYWQNEYKKLNQKVPSEFSVNNLPDSAQCKRYLISTDMGEGKKFYATLAIPKNGKPKFPLIVSVLPAGNWGHSCWEFPGAIRMTISAFTKEFPNKKEFDNEYYYRGTEKGREGYFFHDTIIGIMRMLDYAPSRPEWDGKNMIAMGQSQGGGFALISAAVCPRITAVIADVPALCDHNGSLAGRRGGWPINLTKKFPRFAEDARYFDAANFACFIQCPVIMSTGLIDPLCIPSSVYAAYNNLKCEKKIFSDPLTGHGYGRKGTMFQMMPVDSFIKEQVAKQKGK